MSLTDLVVGRHEISGSNHAIALAEQGDFSAVELLRGTPDREHSLVEHAIPRAAHIGRWVQRSELFPFDVYMVSEYRRAQQTAHHMALPGAHWVIDGRLNEREWGNAGLLTSEQRDALYPDWKAAKDARPFDWCPDGGETLREHIEHFKSLWHELNARFAGRRAYLKCHGEKAEVIQAVIEGMPEEVFAKRERSLRLHNRCMVHYRRFPGGTIQKRSIDPHNDVCSEWMRVTPLGT